MVQKCSSFEELEKALPSLKSNTFIRGLGNLLYESISTADAIGRSYVVDKDKHFSDDKKVLSAKLLVGKYFTRADNLDWIAAADSNVKISFQLTPLDALSYFKRKAFWISGIENQSFIDEIKFEMERVLTEGLTYEQFAAEFKNLFLKYGIVPDKPIRVDTIFRTNLFTSYTAGQIKQLEQVKDRFPVWRYVAVLDSRTRESHRELNGKLFRKGPFPPINFNCRCTPQFLHVYQIENMNEPVYDSIYEFIEKNEVVDFLGGSTFERWVADHPVSSDIQSAIEAELN